MSVAGATAPRQGSRRGATAALAVIAFACLTAPAFAQASQIQGGQASQPQSTQAQPSQARPGGALTPGLAAGSDNGGASGGTVNNQPKAPNGRANMLSPASRSFSIRNYAGQPIVDATATMTDGTQHKLNPSGPIAAAGASHIIVPLNQCLADVKVQLKNGHAFHSGNLNDCGVTQITVNQNGIQIGSTQSPGAQTSTAAHRP